MINDISFKRFLSLRQMLFDTLKKWGPASDGDGIMEVKMIFDSCLNANGSSFDPYQKVKYEIIVHGENHDGFYFEGDNFENLMDQLEETINKMKI